MSEKKGEKEAIVDPSSEDDIVRGEIHIGGELVKEEKATKDSRCSKAKSMGLISEFSTGNGHQLSSSNVSLKFELCGLEALDL